MEQECERMTSKERLTEILNVPIYPRVGADLTEVVADYLLDNDVVPVTRCKDCEHSALPSKQVQIYGTPGTLICRNPNSKCSRRLVKPVDFCPYGKRKEQEGDR